MSSVRVIGGLDGVGRNIWRSRNGRKKTSETSLSLRFESRLASTCYYPRTPSYYFWFSFLFSWVCVRCPLSFSSFATTFCPWSCLSFHTPFFCWCQRQRRSSTSFSSHQRAESSVAVACQQPCPAHLCPTHCFHRGLFFVSPIAPSPLHVIFCGSNPSRARMKKGLF